MATKPKHTSVFATEHTSDADVDRLIETGLPAVTLNKEGTPVVDWKQVESGDIKYSRGWLILSRAWVEANEPDLIGTLPDRDSFDSKEAYEYKCGLIFTEARNSPMSWGKIMVCYGQTETFVRRCYEKVGIQKSKGLRINKGGRFAYQDPTLYLDNRKAEGAQIPKEIVGRPMVEQLLNFIPKEGDSNAATKGRAIAKIVKAQALCDDAATPQEQRVNLEAQIAGLMTKYGITVQDIARWQAARANKGKGRKAA